MLLLVAPSRRGTEDDDVMLNMIVQVQGQVSLSVGQLVMIVDDDGCEGQRLLLDWDMNLLDYNGRLRR